MSVQPAVFKPFSDWANAANTLSRHTVNAILILGFHGSEELSLSYKYTGELHYVPSLPKPGSGLGSVSALTAMPAQFQGFLFNEPLPVSGHKLIVLSLTLTDPVTISAQHWGAPPSPFTSSMPEQTTDIDHNDLTLNTNPTVIPAIQLDMRFENNSVPGTLVLWAGL